MVGADAAEGGYEPGRIVETVVCPDLADVAVEVEGGSEGEVRVVVEEIEALAGPVEVVEPGLFVVGATDV